MGAKKRNDGTVTFVAFVGAFAILGASVFVILTQGLPLLAATPAKVELAPEMDAQRMPSAPSPAGSSYQAAPPQRTPVSPSMQREAAQRVISGVYRCEDKGLIVYTDQPCPNGQPVDIRPNGGFFAPRAAAPGTVNQPRSDTGLITTGRSQNRP
jgi:hypothetical protein